MSDPAKEPRCDAKLKNLPEDRQREIIEKWKEVGIIKTQAWLHDDGFDVSTGSLSEWRSWYVLKAQYQRRESRVLQLMELRQKKEPGISEADLFEYGQEVFSTLALEDEDRESWVSVQQLTLSKNLEQAKLKIRKQAESRMQEKHQFEVEKFQFDGAKAALKHLRELQVINAQRIPEAEKIQKVRERLFGVLPPSPPK